MKPLIPLALILSLGACTPLLGRAAMRLPEPTVARDCADRLWPSDGSPSRDCAAAIPAGDPSRHLSPPFRQHSPIERALRS